MKSKSAAAPILLVEDNPMDIDLTRRAFKKLQLDTTLLVARDGEEALSYLARWQSGEPLPAVILLDINLPKLNGLEVLRHFKAHETSRRIPVVMLTSSSEERDLSTAYDLGVNSYMEKPVNFSRFVEVAGQIESYWCELNARPY